MNVVSLNSELSVRSSSGDEFVLIASKTSSFWFVKESAAKLLVLHSADREKSQYILYFIFRSLKIALKMQSKNLRPT